MTEIVTFNNTLTASHNDRIYQSRFRIYSRLNSTWYFCIYFNTQNTLLNIRPRIARNDGSGNCADQAQSEAPTLVPNRSKTVSMLSRLTGSNYRFWQGRALFNSIVKN